MTDCCYCLTRLIPLRLLTSSSTIRLYGTFSLVVLVMVLVVLVLVLVWWKIPWLIVGLTLSRRLRNWFGSVFGSIRFGGCTARLSGSVCCTDR